MHAPVSDFEPQPREIDMAALVATRVAVCSAMPEADPFSGLAPEVLRSMRLRIQADMERAAELYERAMNGRLRHEEGRAIHR